MTHTKPCPRCFREVTLSALICVHCCCLIVNGQAVGGKKAA